MVKIFQKIIKSIKKSLYELYLDLIFKILKWVANFGSLNSE